VLSELGCDRAQGFLMSRPLNPADLLERMRKTPSLLPNGHPRAANGASNGKSNGSARHLAIAQTGE
jgi:hypothetical protein